MSPLNPAFAIIIFLIAYGSAWFLNKFIKKSPEPERYSSIDGLRGFLALGVFIHHAAIWYHFLQFRVWEAPVSNFYNQLGQTSVCLFFMITSFLFITKLLNSNAESFNWTHFFIARIFRITPMYLVSVFVIFMIIMSITNWNLQTDGLTFILSIFHWCLFTIFNYPLINNYALSYRVNAGVFWSLPYEWLFYFSLPIIAVVMRKKVRTSLLLICFLFVALFLKMHGVVSYHLYAFIGGSIAPFLLKYTQCTQFCKSKTASVILALCVLGIGYFHAIDSIACIALVAIVFTLIACGNTFFGVFSDANNKLLGDMSYSTYLLHGILLFSIFYFLFGFSQVLALSETQYCFLIFLITPILVMLSYAAYRWIEKPGMLRAKKITAKLKAPAR